MAAQASFEEIALKVARGVHDFARKRGWKSDQYRVFIVANSLFSRLRVTVLSKAFHGRTPDREMKDYDDVSDEVDRHLGRERDAVAYI